jgi:hypothetical protein
MLLESVSCVTAEWPNTAIQVRDKAVAGDVGRHAPAAVELTRRVTLFRVSTGDSARRRVHDRNREAPYSTVARFD